MMPSGIYVIDGDTIEALGKRIRLVGFDAPELGEHARCGLERVLAARATSRLRQMIQLSNDRPADRRLLMSARHRGDDGLRLRTILRLSHGRRPGRRRRAHRRELGPPVGVRQILVSAASIVVPAGTWHRRRREVIPGRLAPYRCSMIVNPRITKPSIPKDRDMIDIAAPGSILLIPEAMK
jgi:hypothetical protein